MRFFASIAVSLTLLAGEVSAQTLRLASLDQYSLAAPSPGDRMTVIRDYGPWTLRCELSVSLNRRLCSLEQTITAQGGAIVWRLAQTDDARHVLVFSAPGNLDAAKGLKLALEGFSYEVPQWSCAETCLAVAILGGALQSLMLEATRVEMHYTATSGRNVTLTGRMDGFADALQAAAEDPFGKNVRARKVQIPLPIARPAIKTAEVE